MNSSDRRDLEIYHNAAGLPLDQRAAYLDAVCAGDLALRQRVESLLKVEKEADAFFADDLGSATVKLDPSLRPRADPGGEQPGDQIGRYKLLQQIGEGGMGVVWMAEQEEPVRRKVALKVVKAGMDTKSVIARFEAERQALAVMEHPNIAQVFDGGATETGRPYFVMELVRGLPITRYCDDHHLSTEERLQLFMLVCRAVQHAHQKGVIHRDLKPSNILVTLHDGRPVPKVIDFGIAKATQTRLTDRTLFTQFNTFVGTPAYCSPEQAELSGLDLDTRSDIYSLGVLLYELLTGRTPFDARRLLEAGFEGMLRIIREQEPARPSTRLGTLADNDLTTTARHHRTEAARLIRYIRGDLDWIVMKCLEKDRTRRYETAGDLAQDLRRHLTNEPVQARPPALGYLLGKAIRRNRLAWAAGTAVVLTLVGGVVVSGWFAAEAARAEQVATAERLRAVDERDKAVEAEREQSRLREEAQRSLTREAALRALAEEARRFSELNAYAADMAAAHALFQDDEPTRARDLLAGYTGRTNAWLRGFEWGYLWQATRDSTAPPGETYRMPIPEWLSSDGNSLGRFNRDGPLGRFQRLEIATSNLLSEIVIPTSQIQGWYLSRDLHWLTVADPANRLKVWDFSAGTLVGETESKLKGRPMFSIDSQRVFVAHSGSVQIWQVPGLTPVALLSNVHQVVHLMQDVLITRSPDGSPEIWLRHLRDGRVFAKLQGHQGEIPLLDTSWDGKLLATPSTDGTVRVWDLTTGELRHTLLAKLAGNNLVQFSPSGKTLATAGADGSVTLWSIATGRRLMTLKTPGGPLNELLFSGDGRTLAAHSGRGTLTLWRADDY